VNRENTVKEKRNEKEKKTSAKDQKNCDWLARKIFEDLEKGSKISVTGSLRSKHKDRNGSKNSILLKE